MKWEYSNTEPPTFQQLEVEASNCVALNIAVHIGRARGWTEVQTATAAAIIASRQLGQSVQERIEEAKKTPLVIEIDGKLFFRKPQKES